MKLNELKQLIDERARLQRACSSNNGVQDIKTIERLDEITKVLNKLKDSGKLQVNIKVLGDNLKQYFIDKDAITANLTYSQYTNSKDIHPFDDEDKCVYNANAVGVLTLIYEDEGRICKRLYEVFDAKAKLIGSGAQYISYNNQNGTYYINEFENISIFDLVPSFDNYMFNNTSALINDYPSIVDVMYQSLEQTQRMKLKDTRRLVTKMIAGNHSNNPRIKQNYLTDALANIKKQEANGVEY